MALNDRLCVVADWQSKMHPLFERYDVDACGTIESKENLTQLTMNALVKFNVRMDMEVR